MSFPGSAYKTTTRLERKDVYLVGENAVLYHGLENFVDGCKCDDCVRWCLVYQDRVTATGASQRVYVVVRSEPPRDGTSLPVDTATLEIKCYYCPDVGVYAPLSPGEEHKCAVCSAMDAKRLKRMAKREREEDDIRGLFQSKKRHLLRSAEEHQDFIWFDSCRATLRRDLLPLCKVGDEWHFFSWLLNPLEDVDMLQSMLEKIYRELPKKLNLEDDDDKALRWALVNMAGMSGRKLKDVPKTEFDRVSRKACAEELHEKLIEAANQVYFEDPESLDGWGHYVSYTPYRSDCECHACASVASTNAWKIVDKDVHRMSRDVAFCRAVEAWRRYDALESFAGMIVTDKERLHVDFGVAGVDGWTGCDSYMYLYVMEHFQSHDRREQIKFLMGEYEVDDILPFVARGTLPKILPSKQTPYTVFVFN